MNRFRQRGLLFITLIIVLSILTSLSVACGRRETQQTPADFGNNLACKTEEMNISGFNGYLNEYGYWHFTGLLSNNSQNSLRDVEILVEIEDSAGILLKNGVVSPMLTDIGAGETSPFDLWVYEALPTLDHYAAKVINCNVTELQRATVEIRNVTRVVDQYNIVNLIGEVVNNSSQPIYIENLAATLSNEAGELVTAASAAVFMHHLEAGTSGPFRIELHAPTSMLATMGEQKLYTNTKITNSPETFDLAINSFNSYLDITGSFHLFGPVTNNSNKLLNVSLVAGIYDEDGYVLDAAAMSLPVTTIAPGESIPIDFDNWGPMSHTAEGFIKATEYSVEIDYYGTTVASLPMVNLTTRDDNNSFMTGQAKFSGQVENNSGNQLWGAVVVVALYEKGTNNLLAAGYTWVLTKIPHGETAPYTITVDVPSGFDNTNMEYELIARGKLP